LSGDQRAFSIRKADQDRRRAEIEIRPLAAGQFGPLAGHATLKASLDVICRDHASFPDAASNARKASDMPVGGSE
jgi:hypothetical protein